MPVEPEPQLVRIEKPIYGGAFLARMEGKAVFVPLTLPGEQVRVRMVEDKRGYALAEAQEVLAAAAERVAPGCTHFGACGGCDYQHAHYEAQLGFKQAVLRETLERGGVRAPEQIEVLAANPWAYRNRIRLAVDGAGKIGYRGRRSHAVVAIAECPIAAPLLARAALAIGEMTAKAFLQLRGVDISLFCDADEIALLAGIHSERPVKIVLEDFCAALSEKIPQLQGAELTNEGGAGETARSRSRAGARAGARVGATTGAATVARSGNTSLTYRAAGFAYRVDQGAFFQVNRWLVNGLVEAVTGGRQGGLAWDLFAGVGLFARRLASSFARVVAVESAPGATAALEHNLSGAEARAVKASTLEFLRRGRDGERPDLPDLIVVDPPRSGLGEETAALLAGVGAPALVYVSCDPATLTRDLRALVAAGYGIEKMTLADLFPQTFHLETVVHLRR
ncbi:MAG TPA: 23S rRNA (uracil(1939)-C(5))-methyltransferase RlmD [Terracidiphilus sp.]|jgi:23S rRNA (uracil1939-C5)-methyltransferase|nr:23S rRNA (uracil(1939)-C(5))-methyltransferase RlmD [Terracidiphilus sp.]